MLGRRITTIVTHDILYNPDPYTRVELCGIFRDEDVATVNELRPDLCGFVVNYPSSHRHVDRDRLRELVGKLDPTIPAVGIFVDQPLGYVSELADEVLDVVQLHGNEGNPYITFLRELVDIPIVQAIRMAGPEDVERANQSKADLVVLYGGWQAGVAFDWELAGGVCRPYILAGALTSQNLGGAIGRLAPWGVALNTGIETDRLNDPAKMAAAVAAARGASK